MFNLFKSKKDNNLYAPVSGKCIDISEVADIGFASKSMGDGIAIIPESDIISSPCDGVIQMIFRTGHAFGIKADNGYEVLIHIGIDTVNLDGKGFKVLKKLNQSVKKGDPIIQIDLNLISESYDPSTLVIVTNEKTFKKPSIGKKVDLKDVIIEA